MKNTNRFLMDSQMAITFDAVYKIGFLCLPFTGPVQDWTFSPQATVTAEYNDNTGLQVSEAFQDELRRIELIAA